MTAYWYEYLLFTVQLPPAYETADPCFVKETERVEDLSLTPLELGV